MKLMSVILTGAAALTLSLGAMGARAEEQVDVFVNNKQVQFPDQRPFIQDARTYVPLRFVSEALGGDVDWDGKAATVKRKGKNIVMNIGSTHPTVDGKSVTIDAAAQLVNERTMVPLRFVSEALGAKVEWQPGRVDITDYASMKVVDVLKDGQPASSFSFGNKVPFAEKGLMVKSFDGTAYQMNKVGDKVLDIQVDSQNIRVKQEIANPTSCPLGLDILLVDEDGTVRNRPAGAPVNGWCTYPVVDNVQDDNFDPKNSTPPANINKVKYIVVYSFGFVAIENPLYKGGK
ncbi:copper amine oxidase-like domain-containing protein [Desulfotomaculum nigrificans CO-1-SRB]|uniref:Copper amine oxidase-like domain-containing protein n=1 Tax=Desulfotomaculum nigrificans (strain DSM 14880 / VKM B-2319 / CO-1-SRB) TaxID=868595 RepID=F6BA63_DESCC|nr:copper amine oxidase N-terminal domain-containing protein [Desulfotomaculum nigrificans]AEF95032.1 copper amine oxidase-like domain-containing protein [Desulfotomaculum nigrificans CO-1-SRB]